MAKTYTALPRGTLVMGTLQCPYDDCKSLKQHEPSASARDEKGKKVQRWRCGGCARYFCVDKEESPLPRRR